MLVEYVWDFVMDAWLSMMDYVECDVFVGCVKLFEIVFVV